MLKSIFILRRVNSSQICGVVTNFESLPLMIKGAITQDSAQSLYFEEFQEGGTIPVNSRWCYISSQDRGGGHFFVGVEKPNKNEWDKNLIAKQLWGIDNF